MDCFVLYFVLHSFLHGHRDMSRRTSSQIFRIPKNINDDATVATVIQQLFRNDTFAPTVSFISSVPFSFSP